MDLKVPYDEKTLRIALAGASTKLEVEGVQDKILAKIDSFSAKTMAEFNKLVSDFHGITVSDLVSSSNYEKLKDEFGVYHVSLIHDVYLEAGFDEKEAWALICIGFGKLSEK